jgi:hypothetical protein
MRVLETCPRRYALQYIGLKEKRSDRTNHRALARRRPAEDHMRRAVSGGIARRLTCLRRGERLSPGDEAGWVADTIRAAFKIGGAAGHHRLDTEPVDDLISRAQHRLRRSREIDILRRIDRDEAAEWLPLERLRPLHTTNESLWTAPDLIVSIDGRWQLIRFAMEAGRSQPAEHQRLELGLVLDWAVREPSLPSDPAAFSVRRIAWRWDRWVDWQRPGSAAWLEESRTLLDADLSILRRAHLGLDGFRNLDSLESATRRRECVTCGFAAVGPVSLVKKVRAG